MASSRIVIIGGGFAGVKCAKTLRRLLPPENYDIVLFNRENHMVFQPLLAEVAGASIDPDAIAAPLRQMLPGVHCRSKEVKSILLKEGFVEFENYEGYLRQIPYSHLVLACGEVINLSQILGMADHAFPLKTVGDAIRLRYHVIQQLEKAEVCTDEEHKRRCLSFIVLGGGFSGVEVAGEINDLVRDSVHLFENIPPGLVTVSIVHSHDQILPEVTPKLRDFARIEMEKAGIKMVLNTRAAFVTPEGVGLNNGSFMAGGTVVCTVGNAMSPIIERLDIPKEHGRLTTEADMRIHGFDNAWAIGDCAYVINSYDNKPSPTTGQFAERQGRQVAENIVRVINGQKTFPFRYRPFGQLCSIGGRNAVAEILGIRVSGFLAWFLWRGIYLFKIPSWSRRVKVGFDWAWDLVFSRDLAYPKADETERISKAYYRPGDYIFHQGDPGVNFYVVESGEVEIVKSPREGEPGEVIAVLGPGDFFGEMALVSNKPRNASVRAKTPVEVVVMGKNIFTQISSSLGPLRDLISEAVKERRARQ